MRKVESGEGGGWRVEREDKELIVASSNFHTPFVNGLHYIV